MMHLVSPPPPFSDRMTDACENIAFARFATRAVNMLINAQKKNKQQKQQFKRSLKSCILILSCKVLNDSSL